LESELLELYFLVKTKYEQKMKTEKEKRAFILKQLCKHSEADGRCIDDSALKNRIDGDEEDGVKLVEKFITPILNQAKKEKTGSPADPTEETADPLSSIDWDELQKKARWPHLKKYFELFGDHPTWGTSAVSKAVDSAEISSDEEVTVDEQMSRHERLDKAGPTTPTTPKLATRPSKAASTPASRTMPDFDSDDSEQDAWLLDDNCDRLDSEGKQAEGRKGKWKSRAVNAPVSEISRATKK